MLLEKGRCYMNRKTFCGGIHPNDYKGYSREIAYREYLPKGQMVFPLGQHIGKPARPVVKKGDTVLAGQLIAEADGLISANIVSSCSGIVRGIESRRNITGQMVPCIVIDNDGQFTQMESIGVKTDYRDLTSQEIVERVRAAGVIGHGGAGFPTHVKMMTENVSEIKYVIANGAECEPYLTCDDQLMRSCAEEIVKGMEVILSIFPNAEGVVLIEDNKPEAALAMEKACAGIKNIRMLVVPTKYPQGSERAIISVVAGRHLKQGMLPADAGCIIENVGTIRAVYKAVCESEPLMTRGISVTGDAVKEPCNLFVRIGTSYSEILEAAGGIKEGVDAKKAISGGPMMGIALSSLDVPLQKGNNALTVLVGDDVETAELQMTACLRCGRCNQACMIGLVPQMMAVAAERKNYERFEKKLYGMECVACGSCTYVCPAKRPLMQLFKHAKAEIIAAKRK